MMTIRIKNLRLQAVIGVEAWEREQPQDVVVNASIDFDGERSAASDELSDTVDYQALTRRVMDEVEHSSFHLVERLAGRIIEIIMKDPKVRSATVEVDKPNALRSLTEGADSVSILVRAER